MKYSRLSIGQSIVVILMVIVCGILLQWCWGNLDYLIISNLAGNWQNVYVLGMFLSRVAVFYYTYRYARRLLTTHYVLWIILFGMLAIFTVLNVHLVGLWVVKVYFWPESMRLLK